MFNTIIVFLIYHELSTHLFFDSRSNIVFLSYIFEKIPVWFISMHLQVSPHNKNISDFQSIIIKLIFL